MVEDLSFLVAFDVVFSKLDIVLIHDTPFLSNNYDIAQVRKRPNHKMYGSNLSLALSVQLFLSVSHSVS